MFTNWTISIYYIVIIVLYCNADNVRLRCVRSLISNWE